MEIVIIQYAGSAIVAGVVALITLLLNRRWSRADKRDAVPSMLSKLERDICRTQLLLMLSDYSSEHQEIMKLARHYFADLEGNWYMTSIFNKWIVENNIGRPEWFKEENKQ